MRAYTVEKAAELIGRKRFRTSTGMSDTKGAGWETGLAKDGQAGVRENVARPGTGGVDADPLANGLAGRKIPQGVGSQVGDLPAAEASASGSIARDHPSSRPALLALARSSFGEAPRVQGGGRVRLLRFGVLQ